MEYEAKRKIYARIKLIIIISALIYTIVTFANQQTKLAEQLAKRDVLAVEQAELEREMDFRKNELNYIGTDSYIEQQARLRLGWLYPDEVKYVESSNNASAEYAEPIEDAEPDEAPIDENN